MELNSKKIDFLNKTELVKLLDKFHDSTCNFKVIDEKKLKITFYTIEGETRYILIQFKNKITNSFTIYNFNIEDGKINGKIIGNNEVSDLENLNIELIDFLYTNLDLSIYACDRVQNGLGDDKLIQLCEIEYIEII